MYTNDFVPTSSPVKGCSFTTVRYILLAITTFTLLLSAAFGTLGFVVLEKLDTLISDINHIAINFHIFIYMSLGLFCIIGIYAAVVERIGLITVYISLLFGHLLLGLASGIICLAILFSKLPSPGWDVAACLAIAHDQFTRHLCERSTLLKALSVQSFVIMWLIEIAAIVLANSYLSRLRKETTQLKMTHVKYASDGFDC